MASTQEADICCCTGLRGQAGMGGHGCKTGGASVVGTFQWGLVGRFVPNSSEHTYFGGAHVLRRSWVLCSRACLRGSQLGRLTCGFLKPPYHM